MASFLSNGMIQLYVLSAVAIINSAVNGYDTSMMNGLQSTPQWQTFFNNPDGPTLGLVNAILSVGGTIGVLISAQVSDNLGRKMAIVIGSAVILVGVVLQTAAVNIAMFIFGRFVIGFGLAITTNAAPTWIVELAHPRQRGVITGLYNTTWYVGAIVAAWVTYGTVYISTDASWRIPSGLQGLPSLIQVLGVWFLPESPRWLVAHGHENEALHILGRLHGDGNIDDETVQFEFREIKEAIHLEQQVSKRQWKELFATPGNRIRILIIICVGFFSQWSGNGLISYYINKVLNTIGITDAHNQLLINGCLQIWNWVSAITGTLLIDKVGRRPLFLVSNVGMLVSFVIWTGLSAAYDQNPQAGVSIGVVVMIFVYNALYDIAWTPLTVAYPVEILPFTIRAKGMAVQAMSVYLALFFNSYVNPIGLSAIGWKYYIVYCIWLVFELIMVWKFFVETKGRTLEELAEIFDGPDAALTIRENLALRELDRNEKDLKYISYL